MRGPSRDRDLTPRSGAGRKRNALRARVARPRISANTRALLSAVDEIDPRDAVLAANLAFALARDGEHQQAAEMLLSLVLVIDVRWVSYCTANAAFNFSLLPGKLSDAMALFDATMLCLCEPNGATDASDAPGLVG